MDKERIGVATWGLSSSIHRGSNGLEKTLDFIAGIGIKAIELNTFILEQKKGIVHTKMSKLAAKNFKQWPLKQVVEMLDARAIKPINIQIDWATMGQKSEKKRQRQVEHVKGWIDAIEEFVHIPNVLVYAFPILKRGNTDELLDCVQHTLNPILAYCEGKDIHLLLENQLNPSNDVNFLIALKERVPSKSFGFTLDTGNFKPMSAVADNVLKLKDSIYLVHAKMHGFDDKGQDKKVNYQAIIENLKRVHYNGYYMVEYMPSFPASFLRVVKDDKEVTAKTVEFLQQF